MKYVVSDWHCYHGAIMGMDFCPDRREVIGGSDDVELMVDRIIEDTLSVVGKNDSLYFLGDLYFKIGSRRDDMTRHMKRLRNGIGEMHWILGNHDEPRRSGEIPSLFDSVSYAKQIRHDGKVVFLSHYPLHIDGFDQHRLVSIHGHTHGTIDNSVGRLDVGLDNLIGIGVNIDFSPIDLDHALSLANDYQPAPYTRNKEF